MENWFHEQRNNRRNARLNYNNAINFAINLQHTLSQTELPPHCTLRQYPYNEDNLDAVMVDFVHPNTYHTGHVILSRPAGNGEQQIDGFVSMLCSIDRFNGYYLEITVDNLEEMLAVIAFSQNLLQYQPNQQHLNFVRIPNHLVNHWCVPVRLREFNLRYNDDPFVGF